MRSDIVNNPERYINFAGPEWAALKMWLEYKKDNKLGMLLGSDTHDQSNQLRGAIQMIAEILQLERAAKILPAE